MKLWIAVAALAATMAGCVGPTGVAGAPDSAGASGSRAPSDEEAGRAYGDYRYRLVCGDREDCGALWRGQPRVASVSQVACDPPLRSGERRCAFVAHQSTGLNSWNLHPCRGVFRRGGEEWTLLSVLGDCWPPPLGRPAG